MRSLSSSFTKERILRGREIEDRLIDETWSSSECDLFSALNQLRIPTLIIHGDYDFVPAECVAHIAQAIPGARFTLLKDSGHFAYIESPDNVRKEMGEFFASNS